jgi:hypothetical protein
MRLTRRQSRRTWLSRLVLRAARAAPAAVVAHLERWAKMKRVVAICVVGFLGVAGCATDLSVVPPAKKEALRKFLDPAFMATSIAKEREADLYGILEAFSAGRLAFLDERVRSLEFISSSEASVSFSDTGMHGGGVATLKKVGERWIVEQKIHFL